MLRSLHTPVKPLLAGALCLMLTASLAQGPAPAATQPAEPVVTPSVSPSATGTGTATTPDIVTQNGRVGTFKLIQGETWVGAGAERRTPAPGDSIRQADRISTGPSGGATLILRDGTAITVGPNSRADLSRFQFDATTQQGHFLLDLLQGSVRVVTGLLAKVNPERFKVQTPTSVVGVRGTDFIVETQPAVQ